MAHYEIHDPLDVLKHEHNITKEVLDARPWADGQTEAIAQTVDFFKEFVYHCHHTKEEKHLFPRMIQRGIPDATLIPELTDEHRDGRAVIDEIASLIPQLRAGETSAMPTVVSPFDRHAQQLRAHIDKEEGRLFLLVSQILTDADKRELIEEFGKVESDEMGEGVHGRYVRFARQLTGHD